jgi:hypothetical protein
MGEQRIKKRRREEGVEKRGMTGCSIEYEIEMKRK